MSEMADLVRLKSIALDVTMNDATNGNLQDYQR
jgi:hypothetical protein